MLRQTCKQGIHKFIICQPTSLDIFFYEIPNLGTAPGLSLFLKKTIGVGNKCLGEKMVEDELMVASPTFLS
jgi:hypothetical protein